jgi:protein-L-isoaspartate(D-aspartate) O-methyltransferase
MMNFETARTQMLDQQIRAWEVLDNRVLRVLRETPRELFVPESDRELAFADLEIPLGHGQCMLAPRIEGRLLQSLKLEPIDKVLEIGTGSGYLAACLAGLAQEVQSVDIFPDFVDGAGKRLDELGVANVDLACLDAMTLDYAERFDAIAVTASVPTLTDHFVRMLKPRGRLFVVVGRAPVMDARLVTMHPRKELTQESLFETVLTPMLNVEEAEPFVL